MLNLQFPRTKKHPASLRQGVLGIMSWRWLTLTWVTPHYHQRKEVSLLSSGRDQVVHSCYCRQHNCLWTCSGLICFRMPYFVPNELLTDYIWVEYCHTNGLLNQAILMNIESIELYTTTVWVLYSQASRVISIGQLHISLCFHIQPINVVVFNGSLEDI